MNIPIAHCVLKRTPTVNLWVVVRCPYCGKQHTHGAGSPAEDPRRFLGHRIAHCAGSYVLVEMHER